MDRCSKPLSGISPPSGAAGAHTQQLSICFPQLSAIPGAAGEAPSPRRGPARPALSKWRDENPTELPCAGRGGWWCQTQALHPPQLVSLRSHSLRTRLLQKILQTPVTAGPDAPSPGPREGSRHKLLQQSCLKPLEAKSIVAVAESAHVGG